MDRKFVKLFLLTLVVGVSLSLVSLTATGADFPKRPIKILNGSGPGGGNDIMTRGFIPYLEKRLGVSIVIDYQQGAGGKIALEKLYRATPDGYTIMLDSFPRPLLAEFESPGKVNFKTKDFTPIFILGPSSILLVVHSEAYKTFGEFLKAAKSKTLAGGFASRGATQLAALVLMDELGIKVNWVPFSSASETNTALAGKHIDFTVTFPPATLPLMRAGILRPLLTLDDKRDSFFPDVPVPKELGFNIKYVPAIYGVIAPPRTPDTIAKVLEEAMNKAAHEPAYLEWAKKSQLAISPQSSQDLKKLINDVYYPMVENYHNLLKE